jgi:hypothetical protein
MAQAINRPEPAGVLKDFRLHKSVDPRLRATHNPVFPALSTNKGPSHFHTGMPFHHLHELTYRLNLVPIEPTDTLRYAHAALLPL